MRRLFVLVVFFAACCATSLAARAQNDESSDRLFVLKVPFRDVGPAFIQAMNVGEGGIPVPAETYSTGGTARGFTSEQDLVISADGAYLFASNNEGRSISSFAVAPDGTLSAVPGSPFATGAMPTSLSVHPELPLLFVSDLGLSVFEIGEDGALAPRQTLPVWFARDLEVEPGGRFLYVAIMFGPEAGVRGFEISADGLLNELPGSPFRFASSRPKSLKITADGSRLYVLDLDAGLATFAIEPTGELALLGQEELGGFYGVLELTDDGKFFYVGGSYESGILGFELDEAGLPKPLAGSPFPALFTVETLLAAPGSSFLYEITRDTRQVLTISIGAGGELSAIAPPLELPQGLVPNGAVYRGSPVLSVDIDIVPGVEPNRISPTLPGVVAVALLGGEGFDVMTIDPRALRFGPNEASPAVDFRQVRLPGHPQPDIVLNLPDVNGDGFDDLVVRFDVQQAGIRCGDNEATLRGEVQTGRPFQGTDEIVTVGCN